MKVDTANLHSSATRAWLDWLRTPDANGNKPFNEPCASFQCTQVYVDQSGYCWFHNSDADNPFAVKGIKDAEGRFDLGDDGQPIDANPPAPNAGE